MISNKNKNKAEHHSSRRINEGGNFCLHSPNKPSYLNLPLPPEGKKSLPTLLTKARKRVIKYYEDPDFLPSLNYANGNTRQQRTERRDACVCLMLVFLRYLDLVTLTIAIPKVDRMDSLSINTLANWSNLSFWRTREAITDLKEAGIVSLHQPREYDKQKDEWSASVAIKAIPESFFYAIGLGKLLEPARKKATNKLDFLGRRKRQLPKAMSKTRRAKISLFKTDQAATKANNEKQKKLMLGEIALSLQEDFPELSIAEINTKARSLLYA